MTRLRREYCDEAGRASTARAAGRRPRRRALDTAMAPGVEPDQRDDEERRRGRPAQDNPRVQVHLARVGTPYLTIGRGLWQAVGSPRRMDIARVSPTEVRLTAGERYAVLGVQRRREPRLSIGRGVLDSLGLAGARYPAEAHEDRSIAIAAPLAAL